MFQEPEVLAIIKEVFPSIDTKAGMICPENAFYKVDSDSFDAEQTITIALSSSVSYIPKGYEYTSHTYKGSECFVIVYKENSQQCLNTAKRNSKCSKGSEC